MAGFKKTRALSSPSSSPIVAWKDEALCAEFPPWVFDLMWGLAEAGADPVLLRAGKRLCGRCPVRAECLADALVDSVALGVYGGFGATDRRIVARMVERAGVRVRSRTRDHRVERFTAVVAWIEGHPRFFEDAKAEVKRFHTSGGGHARVTRARRVSSRRRMPSRAPTDTAQDALFD